METRELKARRQNSLLQSFTVNGTSKIVITDITFGDEEK